VNWSDLIFRLSGIAAALVGVLKVGAWIASALRAKAKAIGDAAAAEALRTKAAAELEKEVAAMRVTAANYLARTGALEERVRELEVRKDERRRVRADTRGIPIQDDDS
jgi:hypothetical protein